MIALSDVKKGITSIPAFVRKYGTTGGLKRWAGIVYHRTVGDVEGRSIFDEEWDICVLLDACRADELARFCDQYEWLSTVDRYPSLASCTWNWLPRTMDRSSATTLEDTVYVSANPFTERYCSANQFHELDEVWRYAWNEEAGTVYPRPVTDRAIHHWRNTDAPRLLVHYLQPHVPFLTEDSQSLSRTNFDHDETSVLDSWDRVTRGELSRKTTISRYRTTLKRVLDDVDLLLSNVDADRVVVTSDHGEAFGEWGLYGHPPNIDLPSLTKVPWVETTATNLQTYHPDEYKQTSSVVTQTEQLQALGYMSGNNTEDSTISDA